MISESACRRCVRAFSSPAVRRAADVTVHCCMSTWRPSRSGAGIAELQQAAHPGVKVEVQYLENEAYKAKLPTLLQSADAPNIIYSWGGGVMRAQIEAGVRRGHQRGDGRDAATRPFTPAALKPSPSTARSTACRMQTSRGRLLLQQGRCSPRPASIAASIKTWDDFLARGEEAQGGRHHADRRRRRRQVADAFLLVAIWSCASAARMPSTRPRPARMSGFKNAAFVEAGKQLQASSPT